MASSFWHSLPWLSGQTPPANARDDPVAKAQNLLKGWADDLAIVKDAVAKGVVVISKEYVAKEWPMRELHILVDRHRRGEVGLVPLLWFDTFEEFEAIVESYKQCSDHRRLWAEDLKYLCGTTMVVRRTFTAQRALPEVVQEVVEAALRLLRQAPAACLLPGQGQQPVGPDPQLTSLLQVAVPGRAGEPGNALWLHSPGGVGNAGVASQLSWGFETGYVQQAPATMLGFAAGRPPLLERPAMPVPRSPICDHFGWGYTVATMEHARQHLAHVAAHLAMVADNVRSQQHIGHLLLGQPHCLDSLSSIVCSLQQLAGGSPFPGVWTQAAAQTMAEGDPAGPEFGLQRMMQHSMQGLGAEAVSMFLDTACVLAGQAECDALVVWQAWHGSSRATAALRQLKNRHLLSVDEQGKLRMLDVLRWYGWQVVRGEATLDGGCHRGSRLWVHDGRVEPQANAGGDATVVVAQLDNNFPPLRPYHNAEVPTLGKVNTTRIASRAKILLAGRQRVVPALQSVLWLEIWDSECPELGEVLSRNTQLCILRVRNVADMCVLPESLGELSCLKVLDLSGCCGLTKLPESLGRLSSLQVLDLGRCSGLTVLPDAVGQLSSLQELNLQGCSGLTRLPEQVGQLLSLRKLNLVGCSGLTELPRQLSFAQ